MWIEILLVLISLFLVLYRYVTKSFGKWKSLGIPYVEGSFPFGSYNFFGETHYDVRSAEDYKKFAQEKYFGWFLLGKPVLGINDVNLIKHIQVKDFDHFVDRQGIDVSEKMYSGGDLDKVWRLMLTSVVGDEWKAIRSAFTPIFTSGKMKGMLKFIKHLAGDLTNEMEKKAKTGEEFELKDVFGKFSIDALASSAFGVNAESFTNENSMFVKNAAAIFKYTSLEYAIVALKFIPGVSKLISLLQLNLTKPKETRFFRDVILQTIRHRRETKERKNDMVDLMLDCIKEDPLMVEDVEPKEQYEKDMNMSSSKKSKHNLDEETVFASALVLLVAGYDTTGILLSFIAYEMSKNQDIQMKLQEEIDDAFEESGGEIPDYSVIQSMPYLDMVIHETLRFHSPVGMNTRIATKDYNLPGTDVIIKKNDVVSWHAWSLHFDPEHWTNPTQFDPEHFSKEAKATRNPYAFQAFGQGPRACIGMRFALLEAKVAVISVLRNYSFKPGTKTKEPLVIDAEHELGWVEGGLWAKLEARDE